MCATPVPHVTRSKEFEFTITRNKRWMAWWTDNHCSYIIHFTDNDYSGTSRNKQDYKARRLLKRMFTRTKLGIKAVTAQYISSWNEEIIRTYSEKNQNSFGCRWKRIESKGKFQISWVHIKQKQKKQLIWKLKQWVQLDLSGTFRVQSASPLLQSGFGLSSQWSLPKSAL